MTSPYGPNCSDCRCSTEAVLAARGCPRLAAIAKDDADRAVRRAQEAADAAAQCELSEAPSPSSMVAGLNREYETPWEDLFPPRKTRLAPLRAQKPPPIEVHRWPEDDDARREKARIADLLKGLGLALAVVAVALIAVHVGIRLGWIRT